MSTTSPNTNSEEDPLQALYLRVKTLEAEVALLKQKSMISENDSKSERAHRWERVKGSMQDDPEFAEILRLGQEFRKSYYTE